MKGTQLGTWKDLFVIVVALISFKVLGVWFGTPILALVIYFAYRKKKVINTSPLTT